VSRYEDAGLFVVLSLVWGAGFTAIEVGLLELDPLLFAGYRFDVGASVMLVGLAALGRLSLPRTQRDRRAVAAAAVLLVFGNVLFLFIGQGFTTGAVAAVVYSLNPVMTALFAALLLEDDGLDARDVVGVALGLVGVGLVARPNPTDPSGTAIGALLVFGAVLSVASGGVLVQRFDPDLDSLSVTGWAMAAGAVLLHLASVVAGETLEAPTQVDTLGAIAYLGLGGSALAYGIYFTLLNRRGPFTVNLVNYAIPPVAAVLGWALLDERLGELALAGFGCIVAGFVVINRHALLRELRGLRARADERNSVE
jgi:drug/metabolite transporter (DMT)-like permease